MKKFIAAVALTVSLTLGFGGPAMAHIVLETPGGKVVHGPCKAKRGAETALAAAGDKPAVTIAISC